MYRYSGLASARIPPPSPPASRLSVFFAPFPPLTAPRTRSDLAACPSRCTVISAAFTPTLIIFRLYLLSGYYRHALDQDVVRAHGYCMLWYNMGAPLYSTP